MSGIEVVAVAAGTIAAVAAIVSAYRDGSSIVGKIRDRRRSKAAPQPVQTLDTSLVEAPRDIELEKARGVARFGSTFDNGDDVVMIELRQIRLILEASLFRQLALALQDDSVVDFQPLLDVSDLGRDHTITALMQLRQRLCVAASIQNAFSGIGFSLDPSTAQTSLLNRPLSLPVPPTSPARVQTSHKDHSPAYQKQLAASGTRPKSKQQRRESTGTISYLPFSNIIPLLTKTRRKSEGPGIATSSTTGNSEAVRCAPNTSPTISEGSQQGPAASWSSPATSDANLAHSLSAISTSFPLASSTLIPPTPENNYLGYCKGAWALQRGVENALKQKLEFNDGWSSSQVPYLACSSSKCVFAYRLLMEERSKVWHSRNRIAFRWDFLAKSHIEQAKARDEKYAYKCLFCVLVGHDSQVWQGTNALLDHIAGHRGKFIQRDVLRYINCIVDREANEDEEFDINLKPMQQEVMTPRPQETQGLLIYQEHNPWADEFVT